MEQQKISISMSQSNQTHEQNQIDINDSDLGGICTESSGRKKQELCVLFPEGPLKQQWTVCLEKLLLYLKSSLYNQVKIYRSDLAAERNCLGNGRVFPDTG